MKPGRRNGILGGVTAVLGARSCAVAPGLEVTDSSSEMGAGTPQPAVLIIDAKYYSQSMQTGWFGKETVHSANIYQILTYTKMADVHRDGSVSGLLLYARTDAARQPNVDVVIQGNRIGARTLDLNRPWASLRTEPEEIVTWLAH